VTCLSTSRGRSSGRFTFRSPACRKPEGYPQGPDARVHLRDGAAELAGSEARGGPGIPDGRVLSDPKLERAGLPDGARQETVTRDEAVACVPGSTLVIISVTSMAGYAALASILPGTVGFRSQTTEMLWWDSWKPSARPPSSQEACGPVRAPRGEGVEFWLTWTFPGPQRWAVSETA
jgi:hypothetical protein